MILPGQSTKPLVKLPRKPEECWPWIGAKNEQGRAVKCINGTNHSAQRWLWTQLFGPLSSDLSVSTSCNRPDCMNPFHFRALTRAELNQERSGLTPADVAVIRHKAIHGGVRHDTLALEHDVHPATITKIVNGQRWKKPAAPKNPTTTTNSGSPA